MLDFDVILGIDRLSSHHTILDCYAKTVALALLGIPSVVWQSAYSHTPMGIIFSMRAQWLVSLGSLA